MKRTVDTIKLIRDHGGWSKLTYVKVKTAFVILLLEQYKFWRHYIDKLKATSNSYMRTRTDKERYSLNKENVDNSLALTWALIMLAICELPLAGVPSEITDTIRD